MAKPSKFWDRHAERYARSPVADEAAYQKKLEVTRGYFRPDMEVLEFACGTGSTALLHAPYVKQIRAIDISAKMLEIAEGKAAAQGIGNVTFEQADIDRFEAPDHSFDVVLGHSILHLLEDKEAVLAKVRRLLKPGGVFVASTVCLGDKMKFFKLIAPIGKAVGLMPLVRVFTKQELETSVSGSGFAIEYSWQPRKSMAVFIVAKPAG